MKLSSDEIQKIKGVVVGAKVSSGYTRGYNGEHVITNSGKITDFTIKEYNGNPRWTIVTSFNYLPFYDFAKVVRGGDSYRTSSKRVKDLSEAYIRGVNKDEVGFHKYLEDLDPEFQIENVTIETDEIEWLKKHVTRISARFPSKYKKAFRKAFPDEPFTTDDKTWNYSFTMFFDEVDDTPQSLLSIKNKDGNSVDLARKRMCNVSYIWKLVKDYPEFHFGKDE